MIIGINPSVWQKRFAYMPWKTVTGQWVWWCWVEVTGYVANREIEPFTPFNCRIFSTSFCVRLIKD